MSTVSSNQILARVLCGVLASSCTVRGEEERADITLTTYVLLLYNRPCVVSSRPKSFYIGLGNRRGHSRMEFHRYFVRYWVNTFVFPAAPHVLVGRGRGVEHTE